METKWVPNNGGNSGNPNHVPSVGNRNKGLQSTDSAVKEETEKQENPISDRLDSGRGNTTNGTTEHSDSTMSNPVNDKVDTSEKTNDSTNENSAFDLSYFDGIYKTKEKDPLDLSYFESPYDKNKLEDYLKRNVESGNQLAYTQEDLTAAQQAANDAHGSLDTSLTALTNMNPLSAIASIEDKVRTAEQTERNSDAVRNITSKEEALQSIRERHPILAANISDEALNSWADSIVTYNKQRQIQEDLSRNGPTVNSGISKAEENNLLERAASDYSSLSDTEKEMVGKVADAVAANPNVLNQPPEPAMPFETPRDRRAREERNRAREESNQRLRENVSAVNEAREAERREAERARETPTRTEPVPETPTRTESVPTRTEETSSEPETPSRTEETSSETSSETSEDEIPETIDEDSSEETHTVMDAMKDLDKGKRWWEFGSEDYERTRKQIARISPTAEEEFMDFADLINDVVNGSAGDKVKAVLKLISKAAWDTFNILPKVCVDIAKDIVYRLIKGDYDTSGLTEGEQKQVERFSHNRQNVNMMNAMLNTMDKPVESSVRGKGRGQATDEAGYNEGLIEETNDVVSDVTKKYIINHPWVFKAIQRW